ncbi:MAG: hypothetical protein Q9227_007589 [Pyrenula ochraceoflavens]
MFPRSGNVEVLPPASFGKDTIKKLSNRTAQKDKPFASQADGGLPRAASYTTLPDAAESPNESGIKRTFSENVLALPDDALENRKGAVPNKDVLRRSSIGAKEVKPVSTVTPGKQRERGAQSRKSNGVPKRAAKDEVEPPKTPTRSISGTVRRLSRKSWVFSSSRSPSPSRQDKEAKQAEKNKRKSFSKSTSNLVMSKAQVISQKPQVESPEAMPTPIPQSSEIESPEAAPSPSPSPPKRTSTFSSRMNGRRPLSAILSRNKSESEWSLPRTPSVQSLRSLRSSKSTESLVLPKSVGRMPSVKVPQIPSAYSEKSSSLSVDVAKKKDPLWTAFRTLEADFQKFQSKSSALKANVLRTQLLPFLSRYAKHPSNQSLRAEDLDRRVMVLNKWWIGLLEMLNGKNNQSVSGMDRPVFLEGLAGIMTRPEWRIPPFPSSPRSTPQPKRPPPNPSRSTSSLESGGADFLTETIFNNVRNIFHQNLLSQMSFVVDKMSMRTAPASLVAFCGKACAYAFVFCPRVADILVRLWLLSPAILKHMHAEFAIPRATNMHVVATDLACHFPPALRGLCLHAPSALIRYLRQHSPLPLGSDFINWHGPWKARWSGRDSDLFFVFAKHYHSLIIEFLPADTPKRNRACIPGLIPVHAQMLVVLESTIYRQAGQQQQLEAYASSLFDELEGPDAAAATMPLTSANAARSMAENRLVMVLRDVLAENSPELHPLREFYADEVLDTLLKRLNTTWSHFLYLRDDAEKRDLMPPSTAPCSPAPGRRIVIIRNDSLPLANPFFATFDRVMTMPSPAQDSPYRSQSSILSNVPTASAPPAPEKKRWSMLKSIIPFSTPGNTRPGEVTPPSSASEDSTPVPEDTNLNDSPGTKTPTTRSRPLTPTHQQFSFKFSLEWLDRPAWPSKNRRLFAPKLPPPAQAILERRESVEASKAIMPSRPDLKDTKYAGRALAEWAQIVSECQGFFERRLQEGVPNLKMVETPTLGVESFRMAG